MIASNRLGKNNTDFLLECPAMILSRLKESEESDLSIFSRRSQPKSTQIHQVERESRIFLPVDSDTSKALNETV